MDDPAETDPAGPVRTWWDALANTADVRIGAEDGRRLLAELFTRIVDGVGAEPFASSVGIDIGAALAAAGWVSPDVPSISARVLWSLGDRLPHPEAAGRLVGIVAALGQGHHTGLCAGCRTGRTPHGEAVNPDRPRAPRNLFRMLFDNSPAAIVIGDTDGRVLQANQSLAEMIGVPVEKLTGISVYDFAHPDDHDHIHDLIYGRLVRTRDGSVSLNQRLVRADGSIGWMAFGITYVRNTASGPDYLLAVGADVTEQHLQQEELHHQARHDQLTGLPNRRYLLDAIAEMRCSAAAGDRVGLCFADVDRFKEVNDNYGHSVGDKLLSAIADRLRQESESGMRYLVARIGGDEFVAVVPPPATAGQVTATAHRMAAALSEPIVVDGHRLRVSLSIGSIVTSITDTDAESLLDAADASLYHMKARGPGQRITRPPVALLEAHRPTDDQVSKDGTRS